MAGPFDDGWADTDRRNRGAGQTYATTLIKDATKSVIGFETVRRIWGLIGRSIRIWADRSTAAFIATCVRPTPISVSRL